MDLVRRILKEIEDKMPAQRLVQDISMEGYDQTTVNAHVELLIEAKLLDGQFVKH